MAGRKEYELLFKLQAALGGNFNTVFQSALNTTKQMQNSLTKLNSITGEIDAYRASFLNTVRTKSRKSLHIDADLHRRISSLVWAVGRGEVTVAGFVNQVLAHHFEENGGLINAVLEKYYQSLKS